MEYILERFISYILKQYKNDQTFQHSLDRTMLEFSDLIFYQVNSKKEDRVRGIHDDMLEPTMLKLVSKLSEKEKLLICGYIASVVITERVSGLSELENGSDLFFIKSYILKTYRVKTRHADIAKLIVKNINILRGNYNIEVLGNYKIYDGQMDQLLIELESDINDDDKMGVDFDPHTLIGPGYVELPEVWKSPPIDYRYTAREIMISVLNNLFVIREAINPHEVIQLDTPTTGYLLKKFMKINTRYIGM